MARHEAADAGSFACPCCGTELPEGAEFCRECGASDESGWKEDEWFSDDEEDFSYDEFVRREFPEHASRPARPTLREVGTVALVVLLCLIVLLWSLG